MSWLCAWWCCELAVRVVETGCRCWALVVRMVETAGAGAAGAEVLAVMGRMNLCTQHHTVCRLRVLRLLARWGI